jgi:hypothetical protein
MLYGKGSSRTGVQLLLGCSASQALWPSTCISSFETPSIVPEPHIMHRRSRMPLGMGLSPAETSVSVSVSAYGLRAQAH